MKSKCELDMVLLTLNNDVREFGRVVIYIKQEKQDIILLQDLPHLSDAELNFHVIEPLEHQYKLYRENSSKAGNIFSDNLILVSSKMKPQQIIDVMPESPYISLVGVTVEKSEGDYSGSKENRDCLGRTPVFSVIVKAGVTDSDILENVLWVQKIFAKEKLIPADIQIMGQYDTDAYINLLERVLEVPIRALGPTGYRRKSKRRSTGRPEYA